MHSLALPGVTKKKPSLLVKKPFWWEILSLLKILPPKNEDIIANIIAKLNSKEVKVFLKTKLHWYFFTSFFPPTFF